MSLPIRDLELELDPTKAYSFLLIGSSRSGKTTLLSWLYKKYLSEKINILMTESDQAEIYKPLIKEGVIMCPCYLPQIIKDCFKFQKGTSNSQNINFIIDDTFGLKYAKELTKILTIGRNSRIGVILSGQSKALISSTGRGNLNICCFGKLNSDEEIEKVIKGFLTCAFPSDFKMADKIKAYRDMTKDYHWIVLNNLTDELFITKIKF